MNYAPEVADFDMACDEPYSGCGMSPLAPGLPDAASQPGTSAQPPNDDRGEPL